MFAYVLAFENFGHRCKELVVVSLTLYPTRGFGSRTVRTPEPPSGHCASPPGPPGSPLGSSGPHARALQSYSSDRSVKTPTFAFPALQPGGAQTARKNTHPPCFRSANTSQTLNMDLSSSDRAQKRLVRSGHIAGGTSPAAASAEKVLPMILTAAAK